MRHKDIRIYLADIHEAILKIEQYVRGGKQHFFANEMMQDAVIRQLSIIGEAAGKLPDSVRETHQEIPWKHIIGMRNIIVHDYAKIKIDAVWQIVEKKLLHLKKTINVMLAEQKTTRKKRSGKGY